MVLIVTSASGANCSGYGKLLAFDADGELLGPFSEDARIVDPRGVGVDGSLLLINRVRTEFWRSMARVVWCARPARYPGGTRAAAISALMAGTMSDCALRGRSWPLRSLSI
jgi:hypothetical protein